MKRILAIAYGLLMAICAYGQEYLFCEGSHETYRENYHYSHDGIYYHVIEYGGSEVAVMNTSTLIVYVGGWMHDMAFQEMLNSGQKGGDYSGDVVIPAKVRHFKECDVVKIAYGAFYNCPELTSVSIPESVKEIRPVAFMNCSKLQSTPRFPAGTYIGDNCFYGCSSLKTADLRGVDEMGYYPFQECNNLETIYMTASDKWDWRTLAYDEDSYNSLRNLYVFETFPPAGDSDIPDNPDFAPYRQATLYVPYGSEELYRQAPGWKNFVNIEGFDAGLGGIGGSEVSSTAIIARGGLGEITLESTSPAEASVFDLSGRIAAQITVDGSTTLPLPSGIYIVRSSGRSTKVAVK